MGLKTLYFLTICSLASCLELEDNCNFVHEKRTYFCDEIVDKFPAKFYGRYHLKCTDCHIPVFSRETFPIQAELLSFNLSDSGIQNITKEAFAVLPMLQYLYLQNNRIFSISPGAFVNLKQLYELDLDYNELMTITPGTFNGVESVGLSISHNYIKEVPPRAFEGVLGILALNLSFNKIGILHVESFKGMENLEILDLQYNKICYIPLGIFKHIQMVKELNLEGNKLRTCIPGTLSGLKELTKLNLANNEFAEFDASVLLPLGRISNLDISRNSLYYLDVHYLHTNAPTLRALTIDDNLWSCSLLTNIIQFLKSVNIDTSERPAARYEVTNVNGIACTMEMINEKIPFDKFLAAVQHFTKKSISYC